MLWNIDAAMSDSACIVIMKIQIRINEELSYPLKFGATATAIITFSITDQS